MRNNLETSNLKMFQDRFVFIKRFKVNIPKDRKKLFCITIFFNWKSAVVWPLLWAFSEHIQYLE